MVLENFDGGILALLAGAIIATVIASIVLYVYMSFAFMAISKKAKQKNPGLAWIPGVGPRIIAFKASKMHWWPWLLLIGYAIPFIGGVAVLIFYIFAIIWLWKLFEIIKKPGWWAILMLIPVVNLVILGVAAWSKK